MACVHRPVVGITVDNRDNAASSGVYESSIAYSRIVAESGGLPFLLPHDPDLVDAYLNHCHAVILTGGVDPRTERFGCPTDPRARPIDPRRQDFELALIDALERSPHKPVLGVCLGMQLLALHRGGRLFQYLPEVLETSQIHAGYKPHDVIGEFCDSVLWWNGRPPGRGCEATSQPADAVNDAGVQDNHRSPPSTGSVSVISNHRQAVADPGDLRVVGRSRDGVIEAVDDPQRPFYLGVQWHPERGDDGPLNQGLFRGLVAAARGGLARLDAAPPAT